MSLHRFLRFYFFLNNFSFIFRLDTKLIHLWVWWFFLLWCKWCGWARLISCWLQRCSAPERLDAVPFSESQRPCPDALHTGSWTTCISPLYIWLLWTLELRIISALKSLFCSTSLRTQGPLVLTVLFLSISHILYFPVRLIVVVENWTCKVVDCTCPGFCSSWSLHSVLITIILSWLPGVTPVPTCLTQQSGISYRLWLNTVSPGDSHSVPIGPCFIGEHKGSSDGFQVCPGLVVPRRPLGHPAHMHAACWQPGAATRLSPSECPYVTSVPRRLSSTAGALTIPMGLEQNRRFSQRCCIDSAVQLVLWPLSWGLAVSRPHMGDALAPHGQRRTPTLGAGLRVQKPAVSHGSYPMFSLCFMNTDFPLTAWLC